MNVNTNVGTCVKFMCKHICKDAGHMYMKYEDACDNYYVSIHLYESVFMWVCIL